MTKMCDASSLAKLTFSSMWSTISQILYYIFTFIIIFQVRLPPNTSDDVDEDPTGNKALWDRGLLNGASQKVKPFFNFFFEIYLVSLSGFFWEPHFSGIP